MTTETTEFQFDISNFANFRSFKLAFGQGDVVCIFGAPGTGKTNLLAALKLARAHLDTGKGAYDTCLLKNDYKPGHTFGNTADRREVISHGSTEPRMTFRFRYFEVEAGIVYDPNEKDFFIEEYVCKADDRKQKYLHRQGDVTNYTAFNNVVEFRDERSKSAIRDYQQRHKDPRNGDSEDGVVSLANFLGRICVVSGINVEQLRTGGSPTKQNFHFNQYGINVFSMLSKWKSERGMKERAEWVLSNLSTLFPEIEEVDLPVRGENVFAEFYHAGRKNADTRVIAKFESTSILYTLAYLTAVASGSEGSVIAIDDIEANINPDMVDKFITILVQRAKEKNVHLMLTTRRKSTMELMQSNGCKVVNLDSKGEQSQKKPAGKVVSKGAAKDAAPSSQG